MVYLVAATKSYARNLQYRWAHMANNFGSYLFGLLYISLWTALMRQGSAAGSGLAELGYSEQVMRGYIAVAQSTIWITFFLSPGLTIGRLIRTGEISMELFRPVDFFLYTISKEAGRMAYGLVYRTLPMALMFALTVGLPRPAGWTSALGYAVAVLLGGYVALCMNFLVGVTGFWTLDISWANRFFLALNYSLAGVMLPVELFPGVLGRVAPYLPLAAQCYYPTEIYLGLRGWDSLLIMLAWAVALTAVCLITAARGRRRLEVQGG
ncbi:MAG: ABC transporter permease [Chloroflexota bacterium]